MDKKEFLSWSGLQRFARKFWDKVDEIFVRKTDSRISHMTYNEDSSTLTIDSSVKAYRAEFDEIVAGVDKFDGIDSSFYQYSGNPVKGSVLYQYTTEYRTRLSALEEKVDEILRILKEGPIYVEKDTLVILAEELQEDIRVFDEVLGTYIGEEEELGPMPEYFSYSGDNTMTIETPVNGE